MITVFVKSKKEHDLNPRRFTKIVERLKLTYNHNKCTIFIATKDLLGYNKSEGKIEIDSERLWLLK